MNILHKLTSPPAARKLVDQIEALCADRNIHKDRREKAICHVYKFNGDCTLEDALIEGGIDPHPEIKLVNHDRFYNGGKYAR